MATISYDGVAELARFAKRRRIGFALLSDPKSEIIRAFDVLDRHYPPGSPGHGIANPIVFVIDAKGKVSHRFSKVPYTVRPDIGLILQTLDGK